MPSIRLDIDRPLKWTMRAQCRIGALPAPPTFSDLGSRNRNTVFYALCAHVWACMDVERFAKPEDIAEYFDTPEKQLDAIKAFYDALIEAGILKPKNGQAPTGSERGPSGSSSSGASAPTSGS